MSKRETHTNVEERIDRQKENDDDEERQRNKRQKRKRERPMLNREREWNDVKEINKQSDKEIIDKRE